MERVQVLGETCVSPHDSRQVEYESQWQPKSLHEGHFLYGHQAFQIEFVALAQMEEDARSAIAHTVVLLIQHKRGFVLVVLLPPDPVLRFIQWQLLIDDLGYELVDISLIFAIFGDLRYHALKHPVNGHFLIVVIP